MKDAVENLVVTEETEILPELEYYLEFSKPYNFEGTVYTGIDLSGMYDINTKDLSQISLNRARKGINISLMPEIDIDYTMEFAARATGLPVEFFENLPAREGIKIKNRVVGFLLGSE